MMHALTLTSIRQCAQALRGRKSEIASRLHAAKSSLATTQSAVTYTEQARAFIQKIAADTQSQLRYQITEIGSLALDAVFGEGLRLGLEFVPEAGKTKAVICFSHPGGHTTAPLDMDSGGRCSLAALGLKVAMWKAGEARIGVGGNSDRPTRPIMVMDEPMGHLNDPERELHTRAAGMLKEIADELGVQFLVVTMVEELIEVGERVRLNTTPPPPLLAPTPRAPTP